MYWQAEHDLQTNYWKNCVMNYNIKTTKSFDKGIKRLGKRYASIANDYAVLLDELQQNPQLG